jgi:hypothetical protein
MQAFLTKLLTVDLPGLIVLPRRLDVNIPPSVGAVAEAAVGRDAVMRAVASAVLQVPRPARARARSRAPCPACTGRAARAGRATGAAPWHGPCGWRGRAPSCHSPCMGLSGRRRLPHKLAPCVEDFLFKVFL